MICVILGEWNDDYFFLVLLKFSYYFSNISYFIIR